MRRVGFFGGAVNGTPGPYLLLSQVAWDNSPALTLYKQSGDTLTKLGDPYPRPYQDNQYNVSTPIAISPDGQHFALECTTSPEGTGLKVYSRAGDAFSKIAQNLSSYHAYRWLAYSPDSTHLAICSSDTTTPLTILKRTGDTYTAIFSPTISGANQEANSCAFTPDGSALLACIYRTDVGGANGSTTVYVYSRSGDSYVQAAAFAAEPSTFGISVSRNGAYVAMTNNMLGALIYKLSGATLTYLATLPFDTLNGVAWSPDSTYLAVSLYVSPGIAIYKRTGDTFTKLSTPAVTSNEGGCPAFSADGQYLVIADNVSPYMRMYKRSGDTFTYVSPPAALPNDTAYFPAFFPGAFF